ncbi:MAG: hypothetical protein IPH12_20930 [Saprospirales bacterium]|nr:hypothetical protein [Saprospirales bacterium]MBK8922014.1 hypothetical protein [Saprospirales bacterium]
MAILEPATFLAQTPQRVLDINPGAPGSSPFHLKAVNNQLLFQAYEPAQGRPIWISDGTAGGTHVLKTVVSPQFASGIFSPFFPYGDFHGVIRGQFARMALLCKEAIFYRRQRFVGSRTVALPLSGIECRRAPPTPLH